MVSKCMKFRENKRWFTFYRNFNSKFIPKGHSFLFWKIPSWMGKLEMNFFPLWIVVVLLLCWDFFTGQFPSHFFLFVCFGIFLFRLIERNYVNTKPISFKNATVLVTGGSHGIGFELAKAWNSIFSYFQVTCSGWLHCCFSCKKWI